MNGIPEQESCFPVLDPRFLGCDASFHEASVVLFGAPYDGTASFRPGSRFGPAAMRQDSAGLETYSPYLDRELPAGQVHDLGDLELAPGDRNMVLERIRGTTARIVAAGKTPVMLGGEHLVSLPSVAACLERWPDLCVLHLDAHADLRQDYLGERLSHATVMRRVWDLVGDSRIFQMGIRSGTKDEFDFARSGHTCLKPFDLESLPEVLALLGTRPIYLSLDLDVLDPSAFPGTGTPEPGGVDVKSLMRLIHSLPQKQIIGADLVELAPHYDISGCSTAVALKILRELLIGLLSPASGTCAIIKSGL
ncbi:MAG: agmatinase [Clostridiaceae bacterium]|nr:agmatinase [Clostridiaceae bacterium]